MEPIATYSDGVVVYRLNRMTKHCTGFVARVAMAVNGAHVPSYSCRATSAIKLALVEFTAFLARHTKLGQSFPSSSGMDKQSVGKHGENTDSPANG